MLFRSGIEVGACAGAGGGIRMAGVSLFPIAGGGAIIDATGPATTGRSTGAKTGLAFSFKAASGAGVNAADAGEEGGGGRSSTCKSLAPSRRSCHGNFRAGSPKVWPPKVMLKSPA